MTQIEMSYFLFRCWPWPASWVVVFAPAHSPLYTSKIPPFFFTVKLALSKYQLKKTHTKKQSGFRGFWNCPIPRLLNAFRQTLQTMCFLDNLIQTHEKSCVFKCLKVKVSLNHQFHPKRGLHHVRSTCKFFIGIALLAFRCTYPMLWPCESADQASAVGR